MKTTRVNLRKPTIQQKNLDENVLGYAYQEESHIEIDPRQLSKEYLNTLIHEHLHCFLPDINEKGIERMSDIMTDAIWARRYRRFEK